MEQELSRIFSWIDGQAEAMKEVWENLVRMESPSADREAVAALARELDTYCSAMGWGRQICSFPKAGPTFAAWTEEGELAPVALIGHMDTVHPVHTFGDDAFRKEGDIVYGPGVYDCKGGVTAGLFAMRALAQNGYRRRQIKLVLSGDEEVAHAYSDGEGGHQFELHCDNCAAVFNCESGAENEEVTVERKGGAIIAVHVSGKAAHAGKEPQKGASAIRQAASMILELESHTDFDGICYNCGRITGGKGANIIPDSCDFTIGLRYRTNEQYEEACALIESLCANPAVPGTRCTAEQCGFYPAMEKTEKTDALLAVYARACGMLGAPIPKGLSVGGCSDSAFVTRMGVPALCSLGVQGGGAHTPEEHASLSSIVVQCKKLAAAIYLLPDDF